MSYIQNFNNKIHEYGMECVSHNYSGWPNKCQPHLAADRINVSHTLAVDQMNVSHTFFAADAMNECQPHTKIQQTSVFVSGHTTAPFFFEREKQNEKNYCKYGTHPQEHPPKTPTTNNERMATTKNFLFILFFFVAFLLVGVRGFFFSTRVSSKSYCVHDFQISCCVTTTRRKNEKAKDTWYAPVEYQRQADGGRQIGAAGNRSGGEGRRIRFCKIGRSSLYPPRHTRWLPYFEIQTRWNGRL